MSHKIQDGGAAFPLADQNYNETQTGMSLRDWFAGQALMGLYSKYGETGSDAHGAERATQCYEMADAMLKAREQ